MVAGGAGIALVNELGLLPYLDRRLARAAARRQRAAARLPVHLAADGSSSRDRHRARSSAPGRPAGVDQLTRYQRRRGRPVRRA